MVQSDASINLVVVCKDGHQGNEPFVSSLSSQGAQELPKAVLLRSFLLWPVHRRDHGGTATEVPQCLLQEEFQLVFQLYSKGSVTFVNRGFTPKRDNI